MDRAEAKAHVEKYIKDYKRAYGVQHWDIDIVWGYKNGAPGEILVKHEYERAVLYLDTDEIDDIPKLDRILRHELSHILESPFQLFYDAVIEFVPGDEMKNALASIWFKAKELTVKNIERMHEGHRGYEFKDFE